MSDTLRLLRRLLIGINGTGAGLMMLAVFTIVFSNAFWRYTVGRSFSWGEDLAIYAMIYGIMFGVALAYLQDRHVRFSIVVDLLPASLRHYNLILIDVLVLAVGIGFAISGYEFIDSRGSRNSPSIGLPLGLFQFSTLMGGVLLSVSALTMAGCRLLGMTEAEADA
ncbi:TRAP transporter small permease [Saccharospirillum impatiens]|uniref:TRAP transporter small permease n=1 Tax=Saccharospirillum impatiens TaxID=169438 RepID=UPI000415A817|nr:TRAP transporter small permease [Saccharospirillum impatiens]